MTQRYGIPSEDKTKITKRLIEGITKWLKIPSQEQPILNPKVAHFIAAGALPENIPLLAPYERRGEVVVTETEITYAVNSWTDEEIRAEKIREIKAVCDNKIEAIVPNGEKNRWETRGIRLAWKRIKHLKSPGNNQDLTPQEEELADQLDLLGETTETIREARDLIREDINSASGQPLKDIDSTASNSRWPS